MRTAASTSLTVSPSKSRLAGEHLVQHDTEGPDVRALVDRAPARLLGRHVRGGAEDDARGRAGVGECRGLREVRRGARRRIGRVRLGEAEVEHLDLAVGRELHVRGLEVAVDDALLVRGLERLGDLARDRDRFVDGDRPALEPLCQVLALDQLHREQMSARPVGLRDLLEGIQLRDVRVVQRGEQLRLALEAGEAVGVGGKGRRQQLERHLAAELRVGGAVHLAHPAGADRRR